MKSFSFTYGTVEVRAKMPRGDWIWPGLLDKSKLRVCDVYTFIILPFDIAIWLMPTDNYFGAWPRSGEIDLVEIKGNNNFTCNGKENGNNLMGSTLHYGPDSQHNIWRPTHFEA